MNNGRWNAHSLTTCIHASQFLYAWGHELLPGLNLIESDAPIHRSSRVPATKGRGWSCILWPLTPKIDRATWLFLKFDRATWTLATVTLGPKKTITWDMSNSTGDKGNFKRQRHARLPFLKIDMQHQDPPFRAHLLRSTSFGRPSNPFYLDDHGNPAANTASIF